MREPAGILIGKYITTGHPVLPVVMKKLLRKSYSDPFGHIAKSIKYDLTDTDARTTLSIKNFALIANDETISRYDPFVLFAAGIVSCVGSVVAVFP